MILKLLGENMEEDKQVIIKKYVFEVPMRMRYKFKGEQIYKKHNDREHISMRKIL